LHESQRMDKLSSDSKAGELFAWGGKKHTIQVLHDFKDIKVDALHGNYRQACVLSEGRVISLDGEGSTAHNDVLAHIKCVSFGETHSLAVDDKGSIWTQGSGASSSYI